MRKRNLFLAGTLIFAALAVVLGLTALERVSHAGVARQVADGDVAPYCNPDGEITLADAAVALQILLGVIEPCPGDIDRVDLAPLATVGVETAFDYYGCLIPEGDGVLTVGDVALIGQAAMGLACLHASDVDEDGLSDEHEEALGTDPEVPDSDGDGLLDGEEVHEYGTAPLVVDTDGDGYDDFIEVGWDSDPLDDESFPTPPDPEEEAPEIDPTVSTTVHSAIEFLYTGSSPIQIGVDPGTIEPKQVAVLRGSVAQRSRAALAGVTITALDHPEYGRTLTRDDGLFDMAVNGGATLIVEYQKTGYLPVQRQVDVPWQDHVRLPEVVMIPVDPQVTSCFAGVAPGPV